RLRGGGLLSLLHPGFPRPDGGDPREAPPQAHRPRRRPERPHRGTHRHPLLPARRPAHAPARQPAGRDLGRLLPGPEGLQALDPPPGRRQRAGVRVTVFVEDDAADKPRFGARLAVNPARIRKALGARAPVVWYTLDGEAPVPQDRVTDAAL